MANPLLDVPLLLGHSARIAPASQEQAEYLAFALSISDSSEAELETLRLESRKLRVVDTSSNASYDEAKQQKRLDYVAAIDLLCALGLKTNEEAFVYTPIHFQGVRLKDSDRVRVFEYWRDQCYCLYSYAIHEYRMAASLWSQQTRNCVNESSNVKMGAQLKEFFPVMNRDSLLDIASKANRACVALGECRKRYQTHLEEGASDLAVLAQCGDVDHINSLRKYFKAFTHEVIVIICEFDLEDPSLISEDMDLHAQYAQCVSKNYAGLAGADSTWFPPDRQTNYKERVVLRSETWATFAQILAARHELSVLQAYGNPQSQEENDAKGSLVEKIGDESLVYVHQPIETLDAEVTKIETMIEQADASQLPYSPDETALRLYISMLALKLIETYTLYKAVFHKKPNREAVSYHVPCSSYGFTLCTPKTFARQLELPKNRIVLQCGSLSFVLTALKNESFFAALPSPAQPENALGADSDLHGEEARAKRNERLSNPVALLDALVTQTALPIAASVAYELGTIEERMHWFHSLQNAKEQGITLEDIVSRFEGQVLEETCECYDLAHRLLDTA